MARLVCLDDYRKVAVSKLPPATAQFLQGGADEQITAERNWKAFHSLFIHPRMLRNVGERDSAVKILNGAIEMPFPVGVAPVGLQKVFHPEGEVATARGTAAAGTVMVTSTVASTTLEDIATAGQGAAQLFQVYMFKDKVFQKELLQRAEKAGYKAVVFTVDLTDIGKRRADIRNRFTIPPHLKIPNFKSVDSHKPKTGASILHDYADLFNRNIGWSDLEWLVKNTRLPVLVKGILTPHDANLAYHYGAKGIIVSNHGGRQLDGTLAAIEALPVIAEVLAGKCEVFLDGGVRSGYDVFKALAMGAKAVFVGRPAMWGLTVNGAKGVQNVLEILRHEFDNCMALSGCHNVSEIDAHIVRPAPKL